MKTKAFYIVQEIGNVEAINDEITQEAYKAIMQNIEKEIKKNKNKENYYFDIDEKESETEKTTIKQTTYTINATHTVLYKVECKKGYVFD